MNSRAGMFVQAARGPVLLILVGVLFALQQAGVLDFMRSWPLLIIAIGVMKLIERMVAAPVPQVPPPPPGAGPYAGAGGPYTPSGYNGGATR
ncbi:MAG TPA: DUF5668 domain-containing protein [Bryobacteraceae bacterium]|jgi:hypothetical protein|nr:DUF5668 domain-containing protein [Bryobacteraceae bacterium]